MRTNICVTRHKKCTTLYASLCLKSFVLCGQFMCNDLLLKVNKKMKDLLRFFVASGTYIQLCKTYSLSNIIIIVLTAEKYLFNDT